MDGCCDDVKDTKNESHSQQPADEPEELHAVVTMSKILKMKAIHNVSCRSTLTSEAVVTMSKILKTKAIHNF